MLYRDISAFIGYFDKLKFGDFFLFKDLIKNEDVCGLYVDLNYIKLVFVDRYGERQYYDIEEEFIVDGELKVHFYTEEELKDKDIDIESFKNEVFNDIKYYIKEQEEFFEEVKKYL